jgi:Leucine-rich repeat (LRR) protein
LDNNWLARLPASFASCCSLKLLKLKNNLLVELNPNLVALTNLQSIDFDRNNLEALPYEFVAFQALETVLNIDKNPLSAFPPLLRSKQVVDAEVYRFLALKSDYEPEESLELESVELPEPEPTCCDSCVVC